MNTQATDNSFVSETLSSLTFILRQLDVYNWGPFGGRHCAEIDTEGTAIIGPTGSGKTTLVDALMTLITAQPKYNLASTGGHESDRDLMSYIRGVTGTGNNSGDNSHVTRPDKTSTAISALFSNGSQTIRIGALFWINSTSSSPSDLKRLWLFSERDDQSMEEWLEIHHQGGARALKQLGRETSGLDVVDNKKAYLAQLRRFFEVGENAFTLLNRAAGLKQLNSIDEIFRELVLDDHSAFDRAAEVASEFDDLTTIHNELEIARKQQQSLLPIERAYKDYQSCDTQLTEHRSLLQVLPIWFAIAGHRLWSQRVTDLDEEVRQHTNKIIELEQQANDLQGQADTLKDIYLQAGGASIEQLEGQITTQRSLSDERRRHAEDYQKLTKTLGLDDTLSSQALQANQQHALEQRALLQAQHAQQDEEVLNLSAAFVEKRKAVEELQAELEKIKRRPGSNIPGHYQDFRTELATKLNLAEEKLPFVAELIEVKPTESNWRGAIERAIGGQRLRILVPPAAMKTALDWINQRNNRLHVRLLDAKTPQGPAKFLDDGFTRKLNFKKHPHREALKQLLAGIDRHCVDSPTELRHTPHGMTAQGLMSGKSDHFDKQDQQPLNRGWMTGFDNKDRLASLNKELQDEEKNLTQCDNEYTTARQRAKTTEDKLTLLDQLARLEFDTIDLPGAEATLANFQERLDALTDPNSTVGKTHQEYKRIEQQLKEKNEQISSVNSERGGLKERYKNAHANQSKTFNRIGDGLTHEQQTLAEGHLPSPEQNHLDELDQMERDEWQRVDKICADLDNKLGKLKLQLVRLMGDALKVDTGALSETGTELQDIPAYLERLRILTEEALPDKRQRFLSYLNQSSDQGVTQLLSDIENEVAIIEERISDLNETLYRVDYQPGHYLQLAPQRVTHESLRTLEKAQRRLRSAALKDDEGESHYRALENVTQLLRDASENKRTVGARALLDPRYRLQFAVSVKDRHSDKLIEIRTGSQGGSGGEKEIIASYILTASLSYALCPDGATRPLFGTIVLDEAFSKSSQAVAGRIISALQEFGLHPLFVTPNKEMRLLRTHTRSAILVHRKAIQATLTSLSWEELEAHARQKIHKHNEITD